MSTHNIGFYEEMMKIIFQLSSNTHFTCSSSNEPCHEKTNVLVSDLVRHKPGCTATEDG